MRKLMLIAALILFGATLSATTASTSAAEAGQTTRLTASFAGVQLPGRFYDLNQNIGEFAPGAALPLQSCACDIYFTVIEGELTATIGARTEVYPAGKAPTSPPA